MTSAASQQQWLTKMRRLPSSKQTLDSKAITSDPMLSASSNSCGWPEASHRCSK